MPESLPLVMIVDNDEIHREMLENMLEDEVLVVTAASSEECLSSLDYKKPDLLIIDPEGEEVKGFELIGQVRDRVEEQSCSFIVLTENQTFETRIKAYEAGANDFLAKPFQPEELLAKVNFNLNSRKFYRKLKTDADEAMQTALSAMKQSSDLGLILRFMEESIVTGSHADLANVIFRYLQQMGAECSVMIVVENDATYFHCDEDSSESRLMAMCKEKGRIVDVGLVTVINGQNVSILVNEMPTDEVRYGEIKDVLGIMINLADVRARSICTSLELEQEQQFGLQASVRRGIDRVNGMQVQLSKHTDELTRLMEGFRARIQQTLLAIGATETQEGMFMEMVDDSLEEMESAYNGVIYLESDFKGLINELTGMLKTREL